MFCSSGHNFSFEILKESHTSTGQQKGKLAFAKVQNVKYCMKLRDEELESIWDEIEDL